MRRVLCVIQDCERNVGTTLVDEVDRISLALNHSSDELGELLNAVLVSGCILLDKDNRSSLRELHVCVNRLAVEWETRLNVCTGEATPRTTVGPPQDNQSTYLWY